MRTAKEARELFIRPTLPKRFKPNKHEAPAAATSLAASLAASLAVSSAVSSAPAAAAAAATSAPASKPLFLHDNERDDAFCSVDVWIRKNNDFKPLLIAGPSGSGKTALINNFSSNEVFLDQDLNDFLSNSSLRIKPIGVIDCIESLDAKERDILKKKLQCLKRRIILTTEDAFSEPAKSWKKYCSFIDLKKPSSLFLQSVYKAKNVPYNNEPSFPIENISSGIKDSFGDPIKCTRQMILGQKTPEILSDINYLSTLLQSNSIQSSQDITKLAQSFERYSFLNIVDHELDSQSLWTLTELITQVNPHVSASMPWTFQWPRSCAKSKNPSYMYC